MIHNGVGNDRGATCHLTDCPACRAARARQPRGDVCRWLAITTFDARRCRPIWPTAASRRRTDDSQYSIDDLKRYARSRRLGVYRIHGPANSACVADVVVHARTLRPGGSSPATPEEPARSYAGCRRLLCARQCERSAARIVELARDPPGGSERQPAGRRGSSV